MLSNTQPFNPQNKKKSTGNIGQLQNQLSPEKSLQNP